MLGMFCAVPQFQGIELIKHLSTGTHAQRWGGGGGGGEHQLGGMGEH